MKVGTSAGLVIGAWMISALGCILSCLNRCYTQAKNRASLCNDGISILGRLASAGITVAYASTPPPPPPPTHTHTPHTYMFHVLFFILYMTSRLSVSHTHISLNVYLLVCFMNHHHTIPHPRLAPLLNKT
jgi:hypothetical protein